MDVYYVSGPVIAGSIYLTDYVMRDGEAVNVRDC